MFQLQRNTTIARTLHFSFLMAFLLFQPGLAQSQNSAGRGARSAQDIRKMGQPAGTPSASPVCPDLAEGSTATPPVDLYSVNGTLEVTLNLQTDVDAAGRQRYCYVTPSGQFSPTLRVNPGDTLLIHFYNQIPAGLVPSVPQVVKAGGKSAAGMDGMAGMDMKMHDGTKKPNGSACDGGAMDASVSNLHFHGLNVSPACHSDEVVNTLVQPGQEFDYTIQIPSNEPAGLYWYHPHPHGFSEGQVQGGATGTIVVEGLGTAVPSVAGLPEQALVIRDLLVPVSKQNDVNVPAWDLSLDNVPVSFPAYTPAVLSVLPGQQQVWRILNSSADTILNLQYVVGGTAQSVTVIAIDGVPLTGGPIAESSLLMPPGSRAEIVVTTPAIGQSAQLITNYVNTGPDGDYDPTRPIANVVASASATPLPIVNVSKGSAGSSATSAQGKLKPQRFAGLPRANSVAQRTLYFSEQLLDPTDPNSPTNFFITQDGMTPQAYTMGQAPNIVVHSGTVETWIVQNHAMEDHIFHIHQIHFQVMAVNGVPVNDTAIRDTYDLPYWTGQGPYPSITVAMDFRDPNIVGTFVYHCHILQHEDAGMMGAIEVLPPGAATVATIASSAANTDPASTTVLTATVASSVSGGSTPTGQVQFQSNLVDIGNPVTLINGVATLSIAGTALQNGANSVQAFYMGDAYYAETVSAVTTVNDAPFALTGSGVTAPIGSAANAALNVLIASNFTGAVALTCAMPSTLTEAACFINPNSVIGGGPATLTVNTTPAHAELIVAPGAQSTTFALAALSILMLPLLRRKRRFGMGPLASLVLLAALAAVAGCSTGSPAAKDPGTPAGTYNVMVTATGAAGTSPYTVTIAVPITVQ